MSENTPYQIDVETRLESIRSQINFRERALEYVERDQEILDALAKS